MVTRFASFCVIVLGFAMLLMLTGCTQRYVSYDFHDDDATKQSQPVLNNREGSGLGAGLSSRSREVEGNLGFDREPILP